MMTLSESLKTITISSALAVLPGKSDREHGEGWLPAWIHMADTAGIMPELLHQWVPASVRNILEQDLTGEALEHLVLFLALTHDIGKLTPIFSANILPCLPQIREQLLCLGITVSQPDVFMHKSESPHALAGAAILAEYGCPPCICQIICAHHGKPMTVDMESGLDCQMSFCGENYFGKSGKKSSEGRFWTSVRKEWLDHALSLSGYTDCTDLPDELSEQTQLILSGLLITADWIASNPRYCPLLPTEETGSASLYPERVCRAMDMLSLPEPWTPSAFSMQDALFAARFGFPPNAVQHTVLNVLDSCKKPGILILEAPMGCGKTETALAAAEVLASRTGAGGIFFGLPTQATANGIFSRLKTWAEGQSEDAVHSIRLAHGMAELNDDYRSLFDGHAQTDDEDAGLTVHNWFSGRKQALLADFVIGTVDQLLMAALKQKHVMLRHLGLAGKIVVIDECHAYDAYMNVYLDCALSWLGAYGVPVILLSATLPAERRAALIHAYLGKTKKTKSKGQPQEWETCRSYPLLTWTDGKSAENRVIPSPSGSRNIRIQKLRSDHLSAVLREKLSSGGCAGIIVNTVGAAQRIAGQLKAELPDYRIAAVHARFLSEDRAETETELLRCLGKHSVPKDRDRLIVVGTQVLEQSLDIDFDYMITELCPMDLLLQRLGRLHRHDRPRPMLCREAVCGILYADEPSESGAKAVYGEWLLKQTRKYLPDTVILPDSIPELVQEVYRIPQDTDSDIDLHDYVLRRDIKEQKADSYRLRRPYNSDSISGLLDVEAAISDTAAEASVRDGGTSIEVLLMRRTKDGSIRFLPWRNSGAAVPDDHVPSDEECRKIAGQRLRLPHRMTSYDALTDALISELEDRNLRELSEWQQSSWLKGELVLLLDEALTAELCGFHLTYSREYGLLCETMKKEESPIGK